MRCLLSKPARKAGRCLMSSWKSPIRFSAERSEDCRSRLSLLLSAKVRRTSLVEMVARNEAIDGMLLEVSIDCGSLCGATSCCTTMARSRFVLDLFSVSGLLTGHRPIAPISRSGSRSTSKLPSLCLTHWAILVRRLTVFLGCRCTHTLSPNMHPAELVSTGYELTNSLKWSRSLDLLFRRGT